MMRDGLASLAADTAGAVQAVSPETRLGLCQPSCWALDGDMTDAVTRAFAGNRRPYVRLLFSRLGIPYTSRDDVVKALIGDATARILSERDLLDLLAGPLFIDGAALRVLAERSLGALAGVEVADDRPLDFNMEIVRDTADFRDLAGQTIYSMVYLNFGVEKADIVATRALPGTEVLTDYALWDNTRDTPDFRRPGILRLRL